MIGRVLNSVRMFFFSRSIRLLVAACLGLAIWAGPDAVQAQQSGFQTDGSPIYQAVPVIPGPGGVVPAPSGVAPQPANPAYPQMVYPPVYTPETLPTRPPRAVPVPEKKGKFGLFGKRKDKDRGESQSTVRRPMDSEPARVYPDPATAYPQGQIAPQGQMQPRPGYDPNQVPGVAGVPSDPYGRPVTPGSVAAPDPGMQPRPPLDSRYPVYTTQPAVPPVYPGPGLATTTLPPLPDSPPAQEPVMVPGAVAQAEPYPTSGEAPIFRREPGPEPMAPAVPPAPGSEPVLIPAPAPGSAAMVSNAPIFRGGQATMPPVEAPAPAQSGPAADPAKTAPPGVPSSTGLAGTLPPPKRETPPSTPAKPDEFAGLPFASPVPGKIGFVTLSTYSGEIDVRGIAPGTPVEIPDPRDGNKTIQFRVP